MRMARKVKRDRVVRLFRFGHNVWQISELKPKNDESMDRYTGDAKLGDFVSDHPGTFRAGRVDGRADFRRVESRRIGLLWRE